MRATNCAERTRLWNEGAALYGWDVGQHSRRIP